MRSTYILATLVATLFPALVQPQQAGQSPSPRIRIVPQSSDGTTQDMEESIDGTRLLTHDKGYAPRLWDAKRQILLAALTGHSDAVTTVTFSPEGSRILTLSGSELRVWSSLRARQTAGLRAPEGDRFTTASFSPSGDRIALGTEQGYVFIVASNAPTERLALGKHGGKVLALAFDVTGKRLASGAADASGRMWDAASGAPRWQIDAHKAAIRWLTFSQDGSLLLTTGLDDTASIFDADSGSLMSSHSHRIGERGIPNVQMGAQFAGPGSKFVVTAGATGDLVFYSPGKRQPEFVLKGHTQEVREIRRSKDGRYLATYASDMTLRMWDTVEQKELPFNVAAGVPTAADFSPKADVFWLGYDEGEIYKYDVATGDYTQATYGDVVPLGPTELLSDERRLWMRSAYESFFAGRTSAHLFLDVQQQDKPLLINQNFHSHQFSPNGRYVFYFDRRDDPPVRVLDIWSGKIAYSRDAYRDFVWTPDSSKFVLSLDKGLIGIVDSATGEVLDAWQWEIPEGNGGLLNLGIHPNSQWVVTGGHKGSDGLAHILLWDLATGKIVHDLGAFGDLISAFVFSPDGKRLLVLGWGSYQMFDTTSGKLTFEDNLKRSVYASEAAFSSDGLRYATKSSDGVEVFDASTGKSLFKKPQEFGKLAFSSDGKRVATHQGNITQLWDVDSGALLREFKTEGYLSGAQFANQNTRLLTTDGIGGVTVWDAQTGSKLASTVMMKNGDWLTFDDQGRYDASQPSNVTGAYFVLEWEGGLEPIAMAQLKAQFYEPNLLAKALGYNKEPLRDVPSLEGLKLFPELKVSRSEKQSVIDIQASERDDGGLGKVTVYLNGKQVFSKKGAQYVQFNLDEYSAFLLPEALLPKGQGNLLSVTVANQKGDLVSTPTVLDVGVPKGLKAPDVRLFALCVGVGDYAGTSGDLVAPAADAAALASAIRSSAERLLPGRTDVTLLSTSTEGRPTRAAILDWFKSVSTKASSSDVVLVFFAGHGVSKIGSESGYFFLTSEADPGDITAASVNTATISAEDLKTSLSSIAASKQVVILDTCASGAAAADLMGAGRSVSGEYQRAWEGIKDTTGTWMLAGSAADQKSYESGNVEHGMLTYSLLEAIDKGSSEGLRQTPSGELFLDVERWLSYAANRVESLKNEVGVAGIQSPQFKRSSSGASFDIGVLPAGSKGLVGLKAPKPIVIVGSFEMDQEDPAGLEAAVQIALRDSKALKPWFDVSKHPGMYRIAGSYVVEAGVVKLRLFLQKFDAAQTRKTLETIELTGEAGRAADLALRIRTEIETRIAALEKPKT